MSASISSFIWRVGFASGQCLVFCWNFVNYSWSAAHLRPSRLGWRRRWRIHWRRRDSHFREMPYWSSSTSSNSSPWTSASAHPPAYLPYSDFVCTHSWASIAHQLWFPAIYSQSFSFYFVKSPAASPVHWVYFPANCPFRLLHLYFGLMILDATNPGKSRFCDYVWSKTLFSETDNV